MTLQIILNSITGLTLFHKHKSLHRLRFVSISAIFFLLSCADQPPAGLTAPAITFPDKRWPVSSPKAEGVDDKKMRSALAYIEKNAGKDGINQTLIIRNGQVIFAGAQVDIIHNVYSVTKSFTSTALALLIQQGRIELDTPICEIEKRYCERYPKVTFRHLTTMTSGYNAQGENRWNEKSEDWSVTPFLQADPLFPPGDAFAYWDEAMIIFGNLLTKVAGESIYDLVDREVAKLIGIDNWSWWSEPNTNGPDMNYGPGGVEMNAYDLARFGYLFLNKGRWGSKQILSRSWVEKATSNQVGTAISLADTDRKSLDGRGTYGFNWWVNGINASGQRSMPSAPVDMYYAQGFNNNMLFVIPQWKMIVVRMGLDDEKRLEKIPFYNEFFSLLTPAIDSNKNE